MVSKTRRGPTAKGTPNLDTLLQALRGDDGLVIQRRLADRDPEWARVIATMAKDLLSAVDAGDVAAEVLAELESLSVEDVWDCAGPRRDGYSDPGEVAAEMIDKALEPYADEIEHLIGLGMQVQADGLFRGILRGLDEFGTAPATPFRGQAADLVEEQFGADLLNRRNGLPSHATRPRLDAFLAQFCPKWADWASEMLRRMPSAARYRAAMTTNRQGSARSRRSPTAQRGASTLVALTLQRPPRSVCGAIDCQMQRSEVQADARGRPLPAAASDRA